MSCLLPTFINVYTDDLIRTWKQRIEPGLQIPRGRYLNVLLFTDDIHTVLTQYTHTTNFSF